MGKRKERRLAALSNTGRRVKLDLFVEPSGDLGGSSVNGEIEEDNELTKRAGLPNSPSSISSGQQPQNPLLLLGQYSDDELDEESNKRANHADRENSSSDHDGQEGPLTERKELSAHAVQDLTEQNGEPRDMERDSAPVDVLQSVVGVDSGESDSAFSPDKDKEIDPAKQVSVSESSNALVSGDVCSGGWRMVMHEESNQYYYWNTETGETSWEVPEVLAQTTISHSHQIVPPTENPVDTNQSSSTMGIELDSSSATLIVGGSVGGSLVSQSQEVHVNGSQMMNEWFEGHKNDIVKDKNSVTGVYQSESHINLSAANAGGEATNDEIENVMDLPINLMRQCECLLERLKSLKGYGSRLQCEGQMSKYILEVDIRLSDIKSLSSYASSLLPFWIHSQRQLKQLEDVINNEIYHLAVSAQMDEDADAPANVASIEKEKSCEIVGRGFDADEFANNRESELPNYTITVENDSDNDLPHENLSDRHVSSLGISEEQVEGGLSNEHLEGGAAASEEGNEIAHPEPQFLPAEDVDMDVDMEVDDGVSASTTIVKDASSTELLAPVNQLSQPNTPAEYATSPSGNESNVPLPPEEDWIPPPPPDSDHVPPPPPDNEQVPPPPPDEPPDEPPESSYPPLPPYMETVQPLPYAEQYNIHFADSNFQYYGPTVTVPSSNLYGHADGSQMVVPHASLYYDVVANTYAETAPIIVSSVDPVAYYNIQDGSVAPVPAVTFAESSHLHAESCPVGYSTLASDQIRTIDDPIEVQRKPESDVSAVAGETAMAAMGVTSTSTAETPTATSVKENISAPSTTAATAAPKGQSKVSRSKKRTVSVAPSMRSNKKVSSLVDKWKAAKEELNENEEDEPENAYEILERKRRREIEEWHAKQIASGEAKDNANFQPLGGDWRERVKRRRAQAAKEAAKAASEDSTLENKQPDLAELTKGLPPGWQAYWDEASKQVYYGNVTTSETTWSKPTK